MQGKDRKSKTKGRRGHLRLPSSHGTLDGTLLAHQRPIKKSSSQSQAQSRKISNFPQLAINTNNTCCNPGAVACLRVRRKKKTRWQIEDGKTCSHDASSTFLLSEKQGKFGKFASLLQTKPQCAFEDAVRTVVAFVAAEAAEAQLGAQAQSASPGRI